jgi:tripartite-type tricarboxylate transporter receptor subunit TctC
VPRYEVTTWYALWGIRGTPKPVIDRLYAEAAKFLQEPDVKEIWASQGAAAGGQPPDQFAAFIRQEIAKWAKVVKASGAKIDS